MELKFDDEFLRKLEPLRLSIRGRVRSGKSGERRTSLRGGGGEFRSHRAYVPGDDLRQLDWNVYARLGSLLIRERTKEEAPQVHFFLDTSASMGFGKIEYAGRLAAALGLVALDEFSHLHLQGRGGVASMADLLSRLSGLEASGKCSWETEVAGLRGEGAVLFFLSDFWDEECREIVHRAQAHGEVGLLHILAPGEIAPVLEGRVRLQDSEGRGACNRFVGDEERAEYRRLLEEHTSSWRTWAASRGISYLRCCTDTPWEETLLVLLREGGFLQ